MAGDPVHTLTPEQQAEDWQNIGESLMDSLRINANHPFLVHWHPMDDPAEIVVDMLNELDERQSRLSVIEAETIERCAKVALGALSFDCGTNYGQGVSDASATIATAIRALSTPKAGE